MAKKINIAEIEAARDKVFAEIEEQLATLSPTSRKAKSLRKKRLKLAKKVQKIKTKAAKKKNISSDEKKKTKKVDPSLPKFKKKRGGISYEQRQKTKFCTKNHRRDTVPICCIWSNCLSSAFGGYESISGSVYGWFGYAYLSFSYKR